MKTRNSALCALGLAAAFTFGGAMQASAQRATSQTRIKVTKEQPAATPAKTDTVTVTVHDTVTVRGPTETVTNTVHDTVRVMEMIPLKRLASTFFGIGGGVFIPANHFNDYQKRGWDAQAHIGHYFGDSPIGIRLDGNYGTAKNRDTDCLNCPSAKVLTGDLDLLVRFPLDRKSKLNPILYAMGGGSGAHMTDVVPFLNNERQVVTAGTNVPNGGASASVTATDRTNTKSMNWGYNVGGGLEIDVAGAHLFAETRYTALSANGSGNLHYFPLVFGFNFY
jgi:hypothetical protein